MVNAVGTKVFAATSGGSVLCQGKIDVEQPRFAELREEF